MHCVRKRLLTWGPSRLKGDFDRKRCRERGRRWGGVFLSFFLCVLAVWLFSARPASSGRQHRLVRPMVRFFFFLSCGSVFVCFSSKKAASVGGGLFLGVIS